MNAPLDLDRTLAEGMDGLVRNPQFQQLHEQLKRFHALRVLGVARKEVPHTNTLAWLLDPCGSHGMGHAFLDAFLRGIPGFASLSGPHKVHVENQSVLREHYLAALAAGQDTAQGALASDRPDVVIEGRDASGRAWAAAIEGKVDSREGSEQLSRYDVALATRFPQHALAKLYLTLAPDDEVSSDQWTNIFWSEHIGAMLDSVLAAAAPDARVRAFLSDYRALLDVLPAQGQAEAALAEAVATQDGATQVLKALAGRIKDKPAVRSWDPEPWAAAYCAHQDAFDACMAAVVPAGAMLVWDMVNTHLGDPQRWEVISGANRRRLTLEFAPRGWADVAGIRTDGRWNLYYQAEFRETQGDIEIKLYVGRSGNLAAQRELVRRLFGAEPVLRPEHALVPKLNELKKFLDGGRTVKLFTRSIAWREGEDGALVLDARLREAIAEFEQAVARHDAAILALA